MGAQLLEARKTSGPRSLSRGWEGGASRCPASCISGLSCIWGGAIRSIQEGAVELGGEVNCTALCGALGWKRTKR